MVSYASGGKVISAFDTENDPDGKFIFGVHKDDKDIRVFHKSKLLRNHLKSFGGYCFANNLFYDFGNLYSDRDFDDDILEINSGRTVMRQGRFISLKYKGYPTYFYDLYNFLRLSIESIGRRTGLEKLKFDPYNLDYCVRDTEILYSAAVKCAEFVQSVFGVNPRPSTASYAMAIYKSGGYERIPKLSNNEFFKPGYFGGRTESFFIGRKKMAVYDINSAYPYAMTKEIPFGDPCNLKEGIIRETDFVSCVVDVPDSVYGLLPVKYGWSSLCFPVGKVKGRWWGVELLQAEKCGAIIEKVYNIVRYKDTGYYLKPYAENLYGLRLKYSNDYVLQTFLKLILNSFYGKMATKFIVQKIVTEKNRKEIYLDDYIFQSGSCLGLAEKDYGFVKTARVDIAGYITAVVRASLLRAIMATEPYYCDTDSLFVRPGVHPEFISDNLGAFKKEYEGYITIYGPKMYRSDDNEKIACKGVPKEIQEKALRHAGRQVWMTRPRLWLAAMQTGQQPNAWRPCKKTIKAGAENRYGKSGWTEPFLMRG